MNDTPELSEQTQQQAEDAALAPETPINPQLSATLRKDYDAVEDGLQQANDLTADLTAQLAGKSKQVLHLKFLFEQTKAHLGHMQDSITAMRKERHKLANDAMRAVGLEMMLAKVTAERDRLKNELDGVLDGLATQNAEQSLHFDDRDRQIAELTIKVINLKHEMEDSRRRNPAPAPHSGHRPCPLKTSAEESIHDDADLEVVPTERVPGRRG